MGEWLIGGEDEGDVGAALVDEGFQGGEVVVVAGIWRGVKFSQKLEFGLFEGAVDANAAGLGFVGKAHGSQVEVLPAQFGGSPGIGAKFVAVVGGEDDFRVGDGVELDKLDCVADGFTIQDAVVANCFCDGGSVGGAIGGQVESVSVQTLRVFTSGHCYK